MKIRGGVQDGGNYIIQKQTSLNTRHNQEMVRSSVFRSLGGVCWESWKRRLHQVGQEWSKGP